jgi:glutathione S-transferase
MKLYSGPLSLFTAKVRIVLDEKGITYEKIDVPFSRAQGYQPKHPDVLAINPKGQVPVIVDEGLALYDSTVILEYLEDRYPTPALYPRDARERARCRQLEAAADEVFFPNVLELIQEVFYKADPAARDAKRVGAATERIAGVYERLERELEGREHLCDAFGVADVGWFLTTAFATSLGAPPAPALPRVGAWLARVTSRPSVQREQEGMRASVLALSEASRAA